MESLQDCIDKMKGLLTELIEVALRLRDMSFQSLSEDEIAPLQKKQEQLLVELEKADSHLRVHYRNEIEVSLQEHFHRELEKFQQLNQEFVQNVHAGHGLIQFELHRLPGEEGEDFSSYFSPLRVRPPVPESSDDKK